MSRLFRTVLVPHDFSPHATAALRLAAALAAATKGRLLVLHAIAPVQPFVGVSPVVPAEWMAVFPGPQLVRRERRRLEALVRRTVPARGRVKVTCRVVVGDPFRAILDAARAATAVVMGTLGRTGLPHLLVGSVAEKVVRHAPIPVLTVPARAARRISRRGRS